MINVLLVGSGGREHALAWKIAQSPLLGTLFIAPGNPGTAQFGRNVPVSATSVDGLVNIAMQKQVGLVVVGPEAPLAAGLADACHVAGIPVFGPTAAAAQIESSKTFAKQIMQQAGVPTAAAHTFDDVVAAQAFARETERAWVVKADGLASGKGVIVAENVDETLAAIAQLGTWGAGQRLLDGNQGPNTGGMGAYAPAPHLDAEAIQQIVDTIMLPTVRTLATNGMPFRGALYAGLMLTDDGPKVLEFNARFGDPETQAIMPLLDGDLLAALLTCAEGRLQPDMLSVQNGVTACVVLAAPGYPEAPRIGDTISGIEAADEPGALVFHAGTTWQHGQFVTAGGRVLGVTGMGRTLDAALKRAYEVVSVISFPGMQYRRDIGNNT